MKGDNKKRRRGLPTQMNLIVHILAGAYLLYLAYSIFNSSGEMNGVVNIIFSLIFCVVGAVLIISAARSLQRGEYVGGAADTEKENGEVSGERGEEEKSDSRGRIRFGEPETLPEEAREAESGRCEEKEEDGLREEE